MPRPRKYQPIEMCVCFNFERLFKNVKEEVIRKLGKTRRGEEYHREIEKNLFLFELNGQKFEYVTMSMTFGGVWFVICPKCRKIKRKLYLPNKYEDREQRYLCSSCHGLRTLSAMNGKSPKYRAIIRPLKRMHALKEAIMNKKMSTEKRAALLDEYEAIENTLKNSPAYRLWKFNVEHGDPRKAGI